jgi:hypothetical protein
MMQAGLPTSLTRRRTSPFNLLLEVLYYDGDVAEDSSKPRVAFPPTEGTVQGKDATIVPFVEDVVCDMAF